MTEPQKPEQQSIHELIPNNFPQDAIKKYQEEIAQLQAESKILKESLEMEKVKRYINQIPCYEVRQVNRIQADNFSEILVGFGLYTPEQTEVWDGGLLPLRGWVLGKKSPALTVEVEVNNNFHCQSPVNLLRDHVVKQYEDLPYSKTCGFDCLLNLKTLSEQVQLKLIVVLRDGTRIELFEIRLYQRHLFSPYEPVKSCELKTLVINHLQEQAKLRLTDQNSVFAMEHHLVSKEKKLMYCYISKNACSTFKSVLVKYENMAALDNLNVHDLHNKFTWSLMSSYSDLLDTIYFKFIIIRNPFLRLVSAYLDKLVRSEFDQYEPFAQNVINIVYSDESKSISFQDFIQYLYETKSQFLNEHWRPQVDFLLFNHYDMYLQMENLKQDIPKLEKAINIEVPKINVGQHSTPYSKMSLDEAWTIKGNQLWQILKDQKTLPLPSEMYNNELIAKVRERYQLDIELYENLFGVSPEAMLRPST